MHDVFNIDCIGPLRVVQRLKDFKLPLAPNLLVDTMSQSVAEPGMEPV